MNQTANTVSATYQIKVSTKEGTAGLINLKDILALSTDKVKLENATFSDCSIKNMEQMELQKLRMHHRISHSVKMGK